MYRINTSIYARRIHYYLVHMSIHSYKYFDSTTTTTKQPEYLEIDRIYNIYVYIYIHLLGSECIFYSFNLERNQTSKWLHRRVNQQNILKRSSQQQKKTVYYNIFGLCKSFRSNLNLLTSLVKSSLSNIYLYL